jgi:hypothetical protein
MNFVLVIANVLLNVRDRTHNSEEYVILTREASILSTKLHSHLNTLNNFIT